MFSPDAGLGGNIFTTAQPIRKRPINQGANFFISKRMSRRLLTSPPSHSSWGDRVGLGEPVAKDREKIDKVLLLLSAELEIADLAV
jgi:hypothetical protein